MVMERRLLPGFMSRRKRRFTPAAKIESRDLIKGIALDYPN